MSWSQRCGRVRLSASVLSAAALASAGLAALSAFTAPFPVRVELGSPTAYRSIYIHVPMAWTSYLLFGLALVFGVLYLARRDPKYDSLTFYSVAYGEAFGVATLVSGMAWASESWGAAWSWDPRQTGVLLLILGYLGYFAVRGSVGDPERRRLVSSSYAVAAFTLVILSFASAFIAESLHPTPEQTRLYIGGGSVGPYFGAAVALSTLTALALLAATPGLRECRVGLLKAAGVAVILLGAAAAAALAWPYLTGSPVRVVAAELADGGSSIGSLTLSDGRTLSFNPPIPSPIVPAVAPDGSPSILGHTVVVEGGSVRVATHWTVAFNLLLYSLLLGGVMLLAPRVSRSGV